MTKVFFLSLLFLTTPGFACLSHPNVVLCWETQEGLGTTTRDDGPLGLTGTLTGGPAWVRASSPENQKFATHTWVNMGVNTISFPGTLGIDVRTPSTAALDFSGNKGWSIGISFQAASLPTFAAHMSLFAFNDGVSGSGWTIQISQDGSIRVYSNGLAAADFTGNLNDTLPHRLFVSKISGTAAYRLFMDSKEWPNISGAIADMGTYTGTGGIAITSVACAGVWNGKAGNVVIYNYGPADAAAFANADYNRYMAGRTQQ